MLDDLTATISRHVIVPDGAAEAIALWVMHAHCHDAATHSPILVANSPDKRCGKSTLLGVLNCLVPKPLATANITEAGLFRVIERDRSTLLIDEADTFLGRFDSFRGILNAGHQRSAATVVRNTQSGGNYVPCKFSVWAPKAIFLIGALHPTLMDRSILIPMKRKLPTETVERFRGETEELGALRERAEQWTEANMDALREAETAVPSGLHDRTTDSWRPLLAIADQAAGHWPETARTVAVKMASDVDESVSVLLLADIRDIFDEGQCDRISSNALAMKLAALGHRPWSEWRNGECQLANLLRPFNIRPTTIRFGGETKKGYKREWFEDAWTRYLPECDGVTGEGGECDVQEAA